MAAGWKRWRQWWLPCGGVSPPSQGRFPELGTLTAETPRWPTFWQGQVTGWTGFIRVDNVTYTWFGAPTGNSLYANQTNYEYTSTKSIFTLNAGGLVDMTVTFLSTVTPGTSYKKCQIGIAAG